MQPAELLDVPGMGEALAARLLAALELGRRAACARGPARPRLLHAADVAALLWPHLGHLATYGVHHQFMGVRPLQLLYDGCFQNVIDRREIAERVLIHDKLIRKAAW